jgi:NADH-quinone oxidoreductase subunit N
MAAGYTLYAVLGLVGSYLGIYFYLRVIQFMFMGAAESEVSARASRTLALGASVVCLVPSVLLIVFPGLVIGHIG